MKELKLGMLCLVIGCFRNPANIGRVVETIRPIKRFDIIPELKGFHDDAPGWLIKGENLKRTMSYGIVTGEYTIAATKHLMPLEDDGDNETMDEYVESTMGMEVE